MSLITNIATGTGTVTITSTGHGLANGNICRITNSNSTPNIDGFWTVSGVSGNNFNISTDVTVAGSAGNVGKKFFLDQEDGNDSNDGLSFANRWKTITSGATAARIAPDDFIAIMASPAAVSTGQNASFTNLSKDVVLTTAVTKDLCTCNATTNWTAATYVTPGTSNSINKEGTACVGLTCSSSFSTGKIASYDIYTGLGGELNLSGYTNISFWIRCGSTSLALSDGALKLKLYSDSAATVEVESLDLPAITAPQNYWIPITIKKGSALSSTVRAVALYANASMASKIFYLDNIFACNGLHLQCLIGKNVAPTADYLIPDPWYCIQSIVESTKTIKIDNDVNCAASAGRGYTGTTESVTLYYRETTKTAMAATLTAIVSAIQDSGTIGQPITFSGGWNRTDMTTQTDVTLCDGLNCAGIGLSTVSFVYFIQAHRLGFVRYYDSIFSNGTYQYFSQIECVSISCARGLCHAWTNTNGAIVNILDMLVVNCGNVGGALVHGHNIRTNKLRIVGGLVNNTGCITVSTGLIVNSQIKNCSGYGLSFLPPLGKSVAMVTGLTCTDCSFSSSLFVSVEDTAHGCRGYISDLTYSGSLTFSAVSNAKRNAWINVSNVNSDASQRIISTEFTILKQDSVVHTVGRNAWSIVAASATQHTQLEPVWYPLQPVKALANRAITLAIWMRRNSTAISLGLRVRADGRIPGIGTTDKGVLVVGTSYNKYERGTYGDRPYIALANAAFAPAQSTNWDYDLRTMMTAAADTWERVSLTFTPTADCVFEPEIICWTSDITKIGYFHELTVTQQ